MLSSLSHQGVETHTTTTCSDVNHHHNVTWRCTHIGLMFTRNYWVLIVNKQCIRHRISSYFKCHVLNLFYGQRNLACYAMWNFHHFFALFCTFTDETPLNAFSASLALPLLENSSKFIQKLQAVIRKRV